MTSTRDPSTLTSGTTAQAPAGRKRHRRRRGRVTRVLLWVLGTVVGLVVLTGATWALDTRASDGEVLRNVEVAGRSVGRLDPEGLAPVVASIADDYAGSSVAIRSGSDEIQVPAAELGLAVDQEATMAAALDEGRHEPLVQRPLEWLSSLVTPRSSPVVVTVDPSQVASVIEEQDPTGRQPAVEPSIEGADGAVTVVAGSDGRGLDPGAVAAALPAAAADGLPIVVEAQPVTLHPRFTEEDARSLAASAETLTAEPLAVEAGGFTAELAPAALREWVTSRPGEGGLELTFDLAETTEGLAGALSEAGEPAVDAGFDVQDGAVVLVPARDGTACCADGAAETLVDALRERPATPVSLPLRGVEPGRTTADAEALGVTEPIGSFTTNHAPGESRVRNIHRIADLVRGVVIEPGATFSVNDFVGPRTRAKGFVEGGVIQDGVFTTSVGGGISQFATTLFNAAFFGGLDIPEYQSHSIYISRYPYGREATLSFPKPDLVVANTTPHGVLLWPTYTGSSITVTLYSTRYATGEQTGQSTSLAGACRRVTTERTRTYVDGHSAVDTVFATYRPAEGVDC